MKQRSIEEKKELLNKISEKVRQGSTKYQACRDLGIKNVTDSNRWADQIARTENKESRQDVRDIRKVNNGSEKILKAENARLKTIVAELMLDVHALKEYAGR